VKGLNGKAGFAIAGITTSIVMAQPAFAAQTEITNIQLSPSASGVELSLQVQGNARPPIFSVNRGNSSIIDVSNAQLRLVNGDGFSQPSPAAGIANVDIQQLDADTVRIIVQGEGAAPIADVTRRDASNGILTMTFSRPSGLASTPFPSQGNQLPAIGQAPAAVPPFRAKASAPPVGDIAVGSINANPERIELGSSQIIPKLLLRDAPAREVLTLLGRAAGTNVAFAEQGEDGGPTISLDIENESVDDVFNYVIQLTGLQASRVGQTVFVGKTLPGDAQNRVVRTLRLNQMKATSKVTTTSSLISKVSTGGASKALEALQGQGSSGVSLGETQLERESNTEKTTEGLGAKEILESYGANNSESSATLLKGLDVVADSRTNSITLIGTPNKVGIASQLLSQLDVRKRQAAINVKFIDVNLLNGKLSNADLQFRVNDNLGIGILNNGIGRAFGAVIGTGQAVVTGNGVITNLTQTFLGRIFAEVRSNNAKVLTNPTLIVQEGSSAQVNLTEQVFTGFTLNSSSTEGVTTTVRAPIIQTSGVILNVSLDSIDDNGFVTVNLTPEVSSPSGATFEDDGSTGILLQQRRLETGAIRLRDGQSLVLSGIIRDQDRSSVSKVPILGDIPLLGRLFRDESKTRERSELIVLVTPQILDDSDQSTFGYQYSPSSEVSPLIRQP
jgi:type IV pilus assembly protein PilQ